MTEEITIEPHWSEQFRSNGVITMFLELTEAQYRETPVPDNAKWNYTTDEDGNQTSLGKMLDGFAFHHWPSVNDGKVVMMCCAFPEAVIRQHAFSTEDADDWLHFAGLVFGATEADFFGVDRMRELTIIESETTA